MSYSKPTDNEMLQLFEAIKTVYKMSYSKPTDNEMLQLFEAIRTVYKMSYSKPTDNASKLSEQFIKCRILNLLIMLRSYQNSL